MGQWGSIKVRKLKYKKSNKYYKGTAADGSCWKSSRRQKKGCFSRFAPRSISPVSSYGTESLD